MIKYNYEANVHTLNHRSKPHLIKIMWYITHSVLYLHRGVVKFRDV